MWELTESIGVADVGKACYARGMDEYLTVVDAAEAMGITPRALRWRIERGDVRAERVNPRLWLVPADEVARWRELGKLRPWQARHRRTATDSSDAFAAGQPGGEQTDETA